MTVEEKPKKFTREIIKATPPISNPPKEWDDDVDWENVTKHEGDAYYDFQVYQSILEELGRHLTKDDVVLEIGSRNAKFIETLRSEGINAVGVDINPIGNNKSPQVTARIEKLPFTDATFDFVFSKAVFDARYYEQDHDLMMQEIFRVLKHGGIYMGTLEAGRIHAAPIDGFTKATTSKNREYGNLEIYIKS